MKLPTLTPVKSSNIQALGWNDDGLWVRFHGGALYRYPMATKKLYDDAFKVESVGAWFRDNVRGKLEHLKIDPEK